MSPNVNTLCNRSTHALPVTTILSHVLICTCSLAAARAARNLATFCAGVSASAVGGRPGGNPVAVAVVLWFGFELRGGDLDDSDGRGFCGVYEVDAEGENVEAAGREERTGAGLEKAWGEVEVKRVASMAEDGGRKRRGFRRILYTYFGL